MRSGRGESPKVQFGTFSFEMFVQHLSRCVQWSVIAAGSSKGEVWPGEAAGSCLTPGLS